MRTWPVHTARFVTDVNLMSTFVIQAVHGATLRGHPIQLAAMKSFKEAMVKKLAKKPWIADHCAS
jgi:hypothetical protein